MKKKTFKAAILIIGNEVLSGRTQDKNTSTISIWLNSLGIQVKEVNIIPDVEDKIINTVNILRKNYDYVFTSGGIGPTHDDITSISISKAFNLEYGFHKEAYSILENYYKPGEFNEGRQKMAKMPVAAKLILNPTSGAPGFYIENVFCLPGVPSILESMIGGLNNILIGGDPIINKTVSLRTVESEIAKSITEIQNNNIDVEIGSYPFFKAGKLGVSIVIRSADQNKLDKCNSELMEFIKSANIKILQEN